MYRSFNQAAPVAARRLALAILLALSAFDCGGTANDGDSSSSAGASKGGTSAGGASGANHGGFAGSSGSAASGGVAPAAGTGGAGGSAGAAANAGAAGRAGAAASGGGQACGDETCGENQYCRAPCNGTSLGGSQSLGGPTCAVLPAFCKETPTCECICGGFTFFCTPGAFVIQCGCA